MVVVLTDKDFCLIDCSFVCFVDLINDNDAYIYAYIHTQTGKDALIAAGFVEKFDDVLATDCLVVEPHAVAQMVAQQDTLLQYLDTQLAFLDPSIDEA
jgi:hypothetical protein